MRNRFFLALLLLAAPAAAADYSAAKGPVRVPDCQVIVADEVFLSPREPGILKHVAVTSGQQVDEHQLVLQLEDAKARAELNVAKAKLSAARTKADDKVNEVYAIAANKTAEKELEYNEKANHDMHDTIPKAKIEELQLKCTETKLSIEKALHDRKVAEAEAGIADAEVAAALTTIELLEVKSPIRGEVVEIGVHEGEAVQPGQSGTIHIVGLDRLWVEGLVPYRDISGAELLRQPVTVEVGGGPGGKVSVRGEIVYVSPEVRTDGKVKVRGEFRREKQDVPLPFRPGMLVDMLILPKTAAR